MSPHRERDEDGFTLVELLMATGLMVIIIGALVSALALSLRTSVGLSATSTVDTQDKGLISSQIEAHIGVQSLSRYFTGDVENADNPSDVRIAGESPAPDVQCPRPAPDPSLGTETVLAQVNLRNAAGTVSDNVTYLYSRDSHLHFGQIARYDCAAAGGAASVIIVSRGLSTSTPPTVAHATPTASVPAHVFTVVATTVAGRRYVIDATPAIDVSAAGGGGGAGQTPPTPFTSIVMQDVGAGSAQNGKVDKVVVAYDAAVTIGATCNTGWTLGGTVPSGGTLGAATVNNASHTIALSITEGALAADTSVGSLVVNFNPAGSCTLLGFANLQPIDDASPVVVNVASGTQPTGGAMGKMEPGDSLAITFSEALDPSTIPANVTVTETRVSSSSSTVQIRGTTLNITPTAQALGNGSYFLGTAPTGATAAYPGNVTTDDGPAPTVVTVTIPKTVLQGGVPVTTPCVGTGCLHLAAGLGTFIFNPAATLQSLSAPPAAKSTATTPTVSTTNPPPGASFRMF
jgi:hypothetical protein